MGSAEFAPALGRRLVLVTVIVAVLPLAIAGYWTTQSAAQSGRVLLQSQLERELAQATRDVSQQWARHRADLLMLGENEPTRLALRDPSSRATVPPAFVQRAFARMTEFNRVSVRDGSGRLLWTLEDVPMPGNREQAFAGVEGRGGAAQSNADGRAIVVRIPITDLLAGDTIGSLDASLRIVALLAPAAFNANPSGPLTAITVGGRNVMSPQGVDERIFADEGVEWSGVHWLTVRRPVADPPMEILVAGALDPFVLPFGRAATRGAIILLVSAAFVIIVVVALTRRMMRDVAFELSRREALAAVGEFASELAHEVRNPLTSMRLDLQRVEETAADPESVRTILPRVLRQIERLDRAVTGALRVARGGSIAPRAVDLADVLESAWRGAVPEFDRRGASVSVAIHGGDGIRLDGDAGALEQLFLNLLINAAQSLAPNGEARVTARRRNGNVEVTIADTGRGMTPAEMEQVREPYRSTRRDGTGLGLKIARRIVASHRGEMNLQSMLGTGTTVCVLLPAAD